MTSALHQATLHLSPPVHVAADGEVVPVRRKGLAMLAYVALEGPTRRERLADVLWGHPGALRNLRVEIDLAPAFSPVGVEPIARVPDPVVLGRAVEVAPLRRGVDLLEGLEDVSTEFQEWLEYRRAVADTSSGSEVRAALLDALAKRVSPPFVLVLQGAPGSGRLTLARELARRLGRPFSEGTEGQGPRLRYLAPGQLQSADPEALAARILGDRDGIWVIGRSAFGADAPLLLRLRAEFDPDRWRFERLGPLPWHDARRILTPQTGFHAGARLYLTAGGNPGYLHELCKMGNGTATLPGATVPQRLRAAVELETLRLSPAARESLQRLSVYTGRLSPGMVASLGASEHLDELERNGWLTYDGETWTLADAAVGRLLRSGIHHGQLLRLRERIERQLVLDGARPADGARSDRDGMADQDLMNAPAGPAPGTGPGSGSRSIRMVRVAAAGERCLDEPRVEGEGVSVELGRVVWSRLPPAAPAERVTWPLTPGRTLVCVIGRAQAEKESEHAGIATELFRLTVLGREARHVTFLAQGVAGTERASDSTPAAARFDHAFIVDDGHALQLTCNAACAVVEVDVRCYDVAEDGDPGTQIDAIDLTGASSIHIDAVANDDPPAPRRTRPLS